MRVWYLSCPPALGEKTADQPRLEWSQYRHDLSLTRAPVVSRGTYE